MNQMIDFWSQISTIAVIFLIIKIKNSLQIMEMKEIGSYIFLLGIIVAVVAGLAVNYISAYTEIIGVILVIVGIIVGLLNIEAKEVESFLIAAIALAVTGGASFGALGTIGLYLSAIVTNIATLVAPAAVIVAIKAVYKFAKE